MKNKRWYPKTLGRAARYLRRHPRPLMRGSEDAYRDLVCQIRLTRERENGNRHPYNSSNGDYLGKAQ